MGFPERYALDTPAIDVERLPRAPNPVVIWVTRMALLLIMCALSLCVLVTSIMTVQVRCPPSEHAGPAQRPQADLP